MIINPTLNMQDAIKKEYAPPRKSIFYSYLFSLFLAVLYTRVSSPVIGILNTFFILCTLLVATKQESFLLLMGLHFFSRAITINIGSSKLSFILVAYIIVFFKYYLTSGNKISKSFMAVIVLFIMEFINGLAHSSMPILDLIVWLFSFWYMFEFLKDDININIHDIILYFCLGVWTVCIIQALEEFVKLGSTLDPNAYGKWLTYADSAKLAGFDGRNILMRFGTAYKYISGANGIAFDTSIGICLCLFGLTAKTKRYQGFYVLTIIAFVYFGFLTVSRGFYIELLILFVLFISTGVKRADKLFLYLSVCLVVGFVFVVFVLDNVNVLFDAVSARFDEGNGVREVLIENAVKVFFGSDRVLFFGAGTQYPAYYGFTAHNMAFDSLVSLGSIGCLIYYAVIYKSFRKMNRFNVKFKLYNYIPLIMLASYRMISGRVSDINFYFFIIICFALTQYDHEGEGENICITSR